jgi:signal transduction histidine kinase
VGKGTGLGLYICHEIVIKHCGTIEHQKSNEAGAVFEVRLPVSV